MRRLNNDQFIARLMSHNPAGALCQAMILMAVEDYTRRVAASTPEALDTPMVSGAAWHKCAQHIAAQFDARRL